MTENVCGLRVREDFNDRGSIRSACNAVSTKGLYYGRSVAIRLKNHKIRVKLMLYREFKGLGITVIDVFSRTCFDPHQCNNKEMP